jgi:tetratricopeptide (TPR) repeat protein
MRNIVFVSAFLLIAAASAIAQISDGDQHWAARATGHQGGRAAAAEVDAAIAAYQRAIAQYPNDLEPRWKLLRAIRFKGAYVASTNADKKTIYDMGKHAGEDAVAIIDRQLTAKGLRSITKATEREVADAARSIPGAAQIFQWDAANWGEWALAYGKLAAVREGAADRIRREATIAMLIDPNIEGGGPARILGRLHDQTPHIPFLTGWASSREAVKFLNDAVRIDPTNKVTRVFLAEAMVNNNSDTKPQAVPMLRELISSANNPEYEVEQSAAQDDARALLKKWSA